MRPPKYVVSLDLSEREAIKKLKRNLKVDRLKTRCAVILAADQNKNGKTNKEIAETLSITQATVSHVIKDYCEGGIAQVIDYERNPINDNNQVKIDGRKEALIIAKACSAPPAGYTKWTVRMLAEHMSIVLEENISKSTIQRVLNGNDLKPHLDDYWCIPKDHDAEFVAHMEDILDIYEEPYDADNPLWCFDEKPYQLLDDARAPIPMKPGNKQKIDSEYIRHGTVSIFCFIQPHTGEIHQFVEKSRTAVDCAEKLCWLLKEREPNAKTVKLVCDNLNTHTIASFYKAFSPSQARELARRVDIHHTPVHGSWLDIAEIGLCIMTRQCLGRRIPSIEALTEELVAWEKSYNENRTPIKWQFTNEKARTKLHHLYPDIDQHKKERDELQKSKL